MSILTTPKPKVLLAEPRRFCAQALDSLREWAEVTATEVETAGFQEAFGHYDIIWFRLAHRVTADLLPARPRCRILATPVTGLDHIDLGACDQAGVRVVSLRGEVDFLKEVRGTAELTIALALALVRRLPAAAKSVLEGRWDRDRFQGGELYGKTVGIVGMGRLGTIVAEYLRGFGMSVLGHDPNRPFSESAAERVESLEDLLARSDLITLHVNYHEGTRHLIERRALSRVKPGAVLVNTSRGGVVDDAALLEALRSGRLAGAALDVVDGEPAVTTEHPLVAYARAHDNLLITPHIGGHTRESFEKTEMFIANKVKETWNRLAENP